MKERTVEAWLGIISGLALLVIICLVVNSFFIWHTLVAIGPHQPKTWTTDFNIAGNGEVLVKSTGSNFTITDSNGGFVATGTAGETPLDQKEPIFYSSFQAKPGETYTTNSVVQVYSSSSFNLDFTQYPIGRNLTLGILTVLFWGFFSMMLVSASRS